MMDIVPLLVLGPLPSNKSLKSFRVVSGCLASWRSCLKNKLPPILQIEKKENKVKKGKKGNSAHTVVERRFSFCARKNVLC